MFVLSIIALCFAITPLLVFSAKAQSNAFLWSPRAIPEAQRATVGAGPFRAGNVGTVSWRWTRGGVPWPVAIAAISCFGFGQMLVPGIPGALVGFGIGAEDGGRAWAIMVLALSAIPGTFVAVQVWRAGSAMLTNDLARGSERVRAALTAVLVHNAALFLFAAAGTLAQAHEYGILIVPLLCAPVAVAQMAFTHFAWRAHVARTGRLAAAEAQVAALGLDPALSVG